MRFLRGCGNERSPTLLAFVEAMNASMLRSAAYLLCCWWVPDAMDRSRVYIKL
jgi:hypothetical protein